MHDRTYFRELLISNAQNGYRDLLAKVDLASYRRIPWERTAGPDHEVSPRGVPFFLVSFHDPDSGEPIPPCPRGLLGTVVKKVEEKGWKAMAGGLFPDQPYRIMRRGDLTDGVKTICIAEYEFFNFRETPQSLKDSKGSDLEHMTPGMFGYSLSRPVQNQEFYYSIFDTCKLTKHLAQVEKK